MTAFVDRVAEVVLGGLLHLLQDHRRDLGRRVPLARRSRPRRGRSVPRVDLVGDALDLLGHLGDPAAHEALDREDGLLGVGDRLPLGDLADQPLAVLGERHDRRGGAAAFGVGDDDGVAAFHDRDDGVGRAEVDSDDLGSHVCSIGVNTPKCLGFLPLRAGSGDGEASVVPVKAAELAESAAQLPPSRDRSHDAPSTPTLCWRPSRQPAAGTPRRRGCCGQSSLC